MTLKEKVVSALQQVSTGTCVSTTEILDYVNQGLYFNAKQERITEAQVQKILKALVKKGTVTPHIKIEQGAYERRFIITRD